MTNPSGKNDKSDTKGREAPGPKPELLKLKGNWQSAMKKSLTKKRPPEGWPK
jgi:hypothetical protein